MKQLFLTILLTQLGCPTIFAQQTVALQWAKQMGGNMDDAGYSVAVDASGNVYTTGVFNGTVDFDPGMGTFNLSALGLPTTPDIFVSKFDAFGNFVWAKQLGGGGYDEAYSIKIDASNNIYITGYTEWGDFDPGVGTFSVGGAGNDDIFICKLDTDGNFFWAKSMGGVGYDDAFSMAIDASGNVYTTGTFQDTADFDPSAGIFNLISVGTYDIFVSKLDVSGNFVWAKSMGGIDSDYSSSIALDALGNVYTAGQFADTVDFDPSAGTFNLISQDSSFDIFVSKLDAAGNFVWAKQMGGSSSYDGATSIVIDILGNVYTTGQFGDNILGRTGDFDPGIDTFNLTSAGNYDIFISKLDAAGNFVWAKQMGNYAEDVGLSITTDALGYVYTLGRFQGLVDFDPNAGVFNLTSNSYSIFISKLDMAGNFVWAQQIGDYYPHGSNFSPLVVDMSNNVHTTGAFNGTVDFDPNTGVFNLTSTSSYYNDIFILKLNQQGVTGRVFLDLNQNCSLDTNEIGLSSRTLFIQPGNLIAQTDTNGIWRIDSLPIGNYTAMVDTSGTWLATCPTTQSFTVTNPNDITYVSPFGLISTQPCAAPDVSVNMPRMRPCFSNQYVYVNACNLATATGTLTSAYTDIELDTLITLNSASLTYTALGNNVFRFQLGNINPGQCVAFNLSTTVSCNAILGQTLCVQANLYPVDSCVFDTIPSPYTGVAPCTSPWDSSSLDVRGYCQNDTVYFVVSNHGTVGSGDMDCFSPVRLYIDGVLVELDSIQLVGGDSAVFVFAGTGQTFRLEADQHPLHPGNSHPNATVELCGNAANWTSGLVTALPQDDADPIVDIYCGIVRGSYDPNDKTGYPTGLNTTHDIVPNQQLQYVVQFQNTGTDTAFTVVVRDTLDTDFNIFTVRPGVSSHPYTFRMYGQRVLEWTFSNILLVDSFTNEPASHSFLTYHVEQNPDLPNGTPLHNSASIYFDFNAPIITNQTTHTINDQLQVWNSITQPQQITTQNFLKAYPNPATSELNIEFAPLSENAELVLFNVLGQRMYSAKLTKGESLHKIQLRSQFLGVHFVQVVTRTSSQSVKVILE